MAMTIAQSMLAEFETQAPITQRFLERLPEDKLTWKPHEKSMSAGQLAYHLAFIPGGAIRFVQNNPAQAPEFANFPQPASREEILKTFDESISAVRDLLPRLDDARMRETWLPPGDGEARLCPGRPVHAGGEPHASRRAGPASPGVPQGRGRGPAGPDLLRQ